MGEECKSEAGAVVTLSSSGSRRTTAGYPVMGTREERAEQLGFRPQKEIVYNLLLPYAERLDRESNELLAQIKSSLGRAVHLRELWPGVLFWSRKLNT